MADFGQNAKGGPFAKFSKWPIFLAELQKLQKIEILVRFWPNWYVWTRNLF